ncbi:sn-glycerol-1-phosphate dehydrogenase [Leadbettera azotonutricia]|uniref:Arabinose operon protein AraM n=1 Tax=Leadbettera azotonutricia (strain ATCC BAA-888 / DSM 13862 / ZAS-9) TaxID=545695 RepID=F5YCA5_LEAAZ|nr:sn-glycerol-1-phosphate dehydrogenase [Leadbettera azotonutricia]AEF80240.1 arabinose operon protein AraM [Leadbettera azotonutricia ZAS-9]
MNENTLTALSLDDCINQADETKELLLKPGALDEIPGLLSKFFASRAVCVIADENTMKAAGKRVKDIIEDGGTKVAGMHIFPGEPRLHADYGHVRFLKNFMASLGGYPELVPIAVGSGTVNDLVKCAAYELRLPYLCVPTAASVDGFTPNGAALLLDGFKQTLPCTAPLALAADTEVIARAPAFLSSSGFGDLASKITAGTDWIVAEKAGAFGAPEAPARDPVCWSMIQINLMDNLQNSVNAVQGDGDAINTLFKSLAITGFAMQYMKNSRPVSGGEHLFSHVWEMEDLSMNGVPVTHGHKVTIGTLALTAFTETFFADPSGPPAIPKGFKRPSLEEREAEVSRAFDGSPAHDGIVKKSKEKFMDDKKAGIINEAFRDSWKDLRAKVLAKLLPYKELKELLAKAGCPVLPEAIGLARGYAIATARRAQMIRNRYGVIDIAWDMGAFEGILAKMEKSEIYLR